MSRRKMTKKPIYIIVQESGASNLEVSVNDFIENGYMPIGGVSILDQHAGFVYVQAMILGEYANGK